MKAMSILVSEDEAAYLVEAMTAQVRGLAAMELIGGEPLPEAGKRAQRCATSILRKLGIEGEIVPSTNELVPMGNPEAAAGELSSIMRGMVEKTSAAFAEYPTALERVALPIFVREITSNAIITSLTAARIHDIAWRSVQKGSIFMKALREYSSAATEPEYRP